MIWRCDRLNERKEAALNAEMASINDHLHELTTDQERLGYIFENWGA